VEKSFSLFIKYYVAAARTQLENESFSPISLLSCEDWKMCGPHAFKLSLFYFFPLPNWRKAHIL